MVILQRTLADAPPARPAAGGHGLRCAPAAVALLCAGLCVFESGAAVAQTSGGTISGTLTDEQGRLVPDVSIIVRDDVATVARSVTTDGFGRYRIGSLDPGSYILTAEREGFARIERSPVIVREGVHATVDVALRLGGIAGVVTVHADSPMVDLTSPAQTMNIAGDLQRALPLSSMAGWSDFLLLTPGVATTQARFQTYTLHGTTHASGVFLVDGADATSVLQGSTLYSQFASGTFKDVQVKTGGVDAASPLGLGPVVTISSRSGTDRWHGAATIEYQPERWNDSNTPGGQDNTVVVRQLDGALGGPILRDRWWVFASGRVARNATGNPRSATQVAFLREIEPTFTLSDNRWSGVFAFAKVTGQLSPQHAVLGSVSHDVVALGAAQPNEIGEFRDVIGGGPGVFARLSSMWRSSLLTRVSVGYNGKKQENRNRQPEATGVLVHREVFPSGGRLFGTGPIAALNASASPGIDFDVGMWTVTADASYGFRRGAGEHELQLGLYLQPVRRNRWIARYNNGGFQLEEVVLRTDADGRRRYVPFHRQVFDVDGITTRHVDSRDAALYVQDAWRMGSRLTVNAGVRVDIISRRDRLFDVLTQRTTAIGPRLGLAYSPNVDGRSVVRVSWGRVHENLSPSDTVAGSTRAGVRDLYDPALDGTFGTVLITPPQTALTPDIETDLDGFQQPYADEFIVGFRRQLPGQTMIDVNAMRREYRDRPALVETNAVYDGGAFVGYRDENRNAVYRLTSNSWNQPIVTAVQASVTKETPRLQLVAGYTRSWNRLAGTWQPDDPASVLQPDAFPNRHGIGFLTGCTSGGTSCPDSNSLLPGFGGGTWRDHIVNAGAAGEGPWQLRIAVSYTLQSGPWSGPIHTRLDAPAPRVGPPTITLSNGRVVANPLATTVRFASPTRGDGQLRLPELHLFNLRVGRYVRLGSRGLDLAVDVYNVANAGADQAFQPGANLSFSPFFGLGSTRQFPRAVKVSAGIAF